MAELPPPRTTCTHDPVGSKTVSVYDADGILREERRADGSVVRYGGGGPDPEGPPASDAE